MISELLNRLVSKSGYILILVVVFGICLASGLRKTRLADFILKIGELNKVVIKFFPTLMVLFFLIYQPIMNIFYEKKYIGCEEGVKSDHGICEKLQQDVDEVRTDFFGMFCFLIISAGIESTVIVLESTQKECYEKETKS